MEKVRNCIKEYKAADLKHGDYYYSDGSTSDGGLRKVYDDGTVEWTEVKPTPISSNQHTRNHLKVIGIVLAVGHSELDMSDYRYTGIGKEKCHGYVMALPDTSFKQSPVAGYRTADYAISVSAPDKSSGWFMLTKHQISQVYRQLVLQTADTSETQNPHYWSYTERCRIPANQTLHMRVLHEDVGSWYKRLIYNSSLPVLAF